MGQPERSQQPPKGKMGRHLYFTRPAMIAVGCVLAATALCWVLEYLSGSRVPFMLYIPAALLAAWYGGLAAGAAALLAGYLLGDYVFLYARGATEHHSSGEVMLLLIYGLTTLSSIVLVEGLRRTHARMLVRNQQLEQEMAERRRAEQTLAEAEAKYRCLVEESLVGVYLIQNGHFVYINARLAEIFGYAQEEVSGLPVAALVAPEDRDLVMTNVHHREAGEIQSIHYGFRGLRKDGRIIDVEVIGANTIYHGRRAILGSLLDTTQRKRDEEAMRLSAERFRRIFDESPIGAAIVTLDRRYQQVNDVFCAMTGYSKAELVSLRIEDITYTDDTTTDIEAAGRMARGEIERFEADKRYVRKDGSIIWVHVSARLLRDASGHPSCFLPMVQDITARKTSEVRLHEAKEAAESANRAKDHFLAVLSHELRTPLTAVIPALEALEPLVRGEAIEYVEMARRNVELEARLIDDLLDVTRIARGKVVLDRHPVDLGTILKLSAEVCQADIEARELHFGIVIRDAPHWVHADAARLQQVFWNLLKNAVKFTPRGGCVGVRCHSDHGQVIIEVHDSGVGLEPEALDRIFNAFEQAERYTTRQFGGLGLGLAISKALVEMHGGRICARSDGKGKGATFTVELPTIYRPTLHGSQPLPPEGTTAPGPITAAAGPPRILLVEDHGDTARILRRLLQNAGYQVQHAGDVATALQLAAAEPFDIIVSDLGLPDRSGLELMQELRTRGCMTPGIALTGHGMEEDIRHTHQAGFAEHLTKPVNVQQLRRTIDTVLTRQR